MKSEYWLPIDNHMKSNFKNTKIMQINSIQKIDRHSFIKRLNFNDYTTYKCALTFLTVSFLNKDEVHDEVRLEEYKLIYKEFLYGVSYLMNTYGAKYIKIVNDSIYCFFKTPNKDSIQIAVDCAIAINTFNIHLNRRLRNDFDKYMPWVEFGIGIDHSDNNYFTCINVNNYQEIFTTSDALTNSMILSHISSTKDGKNGVMISMFAKRYLSKHKTRIACVFIRDTLKFHYYYFDLYYNSYLTWIDENLKE